MKNNNDKLAAGQTITAQLTTSSDSVDKATLLKRVKQLKEIKDIQGQDGNWNDSDYMTGLYNGMELALAQMEGKQPVYKSCQVKQCNCNKQDTLIQSILSLFSNDDLIKQLNMRKEMPTAQPQENKAEYFG